MEFLFYKIAEIQNGFSEKFGIPRQSGLTQAQSAIVFEPKYRNSDALRGLEEYSHLWVIWQFSEFERQGWSPTVRPPRLGGNKRMGVFATRSPNRPNPIGLSVVKIEKIIYSSPCGPQIIVSGADLLTGTPILDIKPYLPYADAKSDAKGGFAHHFLNYGLQVDLSIRWPDNVSLSDRSIIVELLQQDPRPAYQDDPNRVYTMKYKDLEIKFTVCNQLLTIVEIKQNASV